MNFPCFTGKEKSQIKVAGVQRLIWNKAPALFSVLEIHRRKAVTFIHSTNIEGEPTLCLFLGSGDPVVTKAGPVCPSGANDLVGR